MSFEPPQEREMAARLLIVRLTCCVPATGEDVAREKTV